MTWHPAEMALGHAVPGEKLPDAVQILLIEDNLQEAELVRLYLAKSRRQRFHVRHERRMADGLDAIAAGQCPDLILLDLNLSDAAGLDGYRRVAEAVPKVPVVILTNCDEEGLALQAVRLGAQDYLIKREVNAAFLHRAILCAIERQRAKDAVARERERYTLALAGASDCIWDWDAQSDTAYFSPRWNDLVGLPAELRPRSLNDWFDRVHPEDLASLKRVIFAKSDCERRYVDHEHRLIQQDGDYLWVYARGVILADADGRVVRMAGSISSIAKRKKAERHLVHRALHDPLTRLPNRMLFIDRLQQALRRYKRDKSSRFAVLYFDLDRFKFVNDSLGHSAGDKLLVSTARRLKKVIRPGDTVARIGGDEFAVLVSDIEDGVGISLVAERIHALFEREFSIDGRGVYTSASIGVAVVVDQYETPEEMLRDADLAMYRAKRSETEKTVMFDATMHQAAVSRLNLEMELRQAMLRGEFVVYYQPIVTLPERRIVAFEALLRWLHPRKGLLAPDAFMAVAADSGMMVKLGWWVLEQACRQAAEWRQLFGDAIPVGIRVNVSASMFRASDAVQYLGQLIQETGIAAQDLCLELTERDGMDHEDTTQEALVALRGLGVKIHMDDFGTGYSSLTYLQRSPYDTLKIDNSFVQDIDGRSQSLAIIKTIVGLGRMLNMNVVAEGVESRSQFDTLVSLQCPEAQGFWFSRPVPPQEARDLLSDDRRFDA